MPVRLYHFTSQKAAQNILTQGFCGTTCWLSPDVATICGEDLRSALLEVCLDLADAELSMFEKSVKDEVWDEKMGDFVEDQTTSPYPWYEIPTKIVAAKGSIRLVSNEERKRLVY